MRIYPSEKVILNEAKRIRWLSLLREDKSLRLPKLKSITILIYDFLAMNVTFLLSLLFSKSCSTRGLSHKFKQLLLK